MKQNDWMNILSSTPVTTNSLAPKGITFNNVCFSEPARFSFFLPPFGYGGLYVVMVKDNNWKPRTYRPIYFGQAGKLSDRVCASHEKYDDWVKEAGDASQLFVSFHTMTGYEADRVEIERTLIEHYRPVCNDRFNSLFRSLFRSPQIK